MVPVLVESAEGDGPAVDDWVAIGPASAGVITDWLETHKDELDESDITFSLSLREHGED